MQARHISSINSLNNHKSGCMWVRRTEVPITWISNQTSACMRERRIRVPITWITNDRSACMWARRRAVLCRRGDTCLSSRPHSGRHCRAENIKRAGCSWGRKMHFWIYTKKQGTSGLEGRGLYPPCFPPPPALCARLWWAVVWAGQKASVPPCRQRWTLRLTNMQALVSLVIYVTDVRMCFIHMQPFVNDF